MSDNIKFLKDNQLIVDIYKINDANFSTTTQKQVFKRNNYYKIVYNSSGRKVKGYIAEPDGNDKLPCIIFNRGGTKNHGIFTDISIVTSPYITRMVDWGYIVITTQYSGNDGSEGKDEFGGMDLDDTLKLKEILERYYRADTNKIGMIGGSRGGTMTYMVLKQVNWLKVAIVEAGVTNQKRNFELRPEMREICGEMFDTESRSELEKRSPIFWANKISQTTPLLILHGTGDTKVSPLDSIEISDKLYKCGHQNFDLVLFGGDNHSLNINREKENILVKEWLDTNLKV